MHHDRLFYCIRLLLAALLIASSISFPLAADSGQTTLRITSQPTGTFRTSFGSTKITAVEAQIKNVGANDAEEVVVVAILPGGERVPLSGPSSLARNKSATYSTSDLYDYVVTGSKIRAEATCSNCR